MLLQSSSFVSLNWGAYSINPSICSFQIPCKLRTPLRFSALKTRAIHDEQDGSSQASILIQDEENKNLNQPEAPVPPAAFVVTPEAQAVIGQFLAALGAVQHGAEPAPTPPVQALTSEVEESVRVLKNAAKTRKVPAEDIFAAFSTIERAKIDSSNFLQTLGGTESPGRTWMLIFTAEKGLGRGRYFPITAIQRFDAAAKRIENGVYLGPLGFLTFEGPFSWKNRILAFVFERLRIKLGPFNPFDISIKGKDQREPSNKDKDPFFIWYYIDEEIAVARGRSGGTAFWVRCRRIGYS